MRIGYMRTSTDDPSLHIQSQALAPYVSDDLYVDRIMTGPKPWPALELRLKRLGSGDTLVIWRLDRIATGLEDLGVTLDQIQGSGAAFYSITEDFTLPVAGNVPASVWTTAIAAFLEQVHLEKIKIGHSEARERGSYIGGQPKLNQDQIDLLLTMFATQGRTNREICRMFGIHETTLYRYVHLHGSPEESAEWASEPT